MYRRREDVRGRNSAVQHCILLSYSNRCSHPLALWRRRATPPLGPLISDLVQGAARVGRELHAVAGRHLVRGSHRVRAGVRARSRNRAGFGVRVRVRVIRLGSGFGLGFAFGRHL